jgi:membrane protein YqaA with SNARE-associated domain
VIDRVRSWIKHLYSRAQHWGRSETCIRDLAILATIGATVIPVPLEPFLIAIILASPQRWLRAAGAAILGTIVGAVLWYAAGRLLFGQVAALIHLVSPTTDWEMLKLTIRQEGMAYLIVATFTPGLFRVAMVTAGVTSFNPLLFVLSVLAGRGTRFVLETGMIRLFGQKFSPFLEKYFDLVTLGIGATAFILLIMIKLAHG